MNPIVIGIDVGGEQKGFHAVALHAGKFIDKKTDSDPAAIVAWCLDHKAIVLAVDAPCRWSQSGSSRLAERELSQKRIWCFSTPTKKKAQQSNFYKWVFNGEKLYKCLESHQYLRFDGELTEGQMYVETFPHAVVCAMAGQPVPARPKARVRREALRNKDYDVSNLLNIDFVDAALCAVAGDSLRRGCFNRYGDHVEGFIVVPTTCANNRGEP